MKWSVIKYKDMSTAESTLEYMSNPSPPICNICKQPTHKHTWLSKGDKLGQFMACPPRKR